MTYLADGGRANKREKPRKDLLLGGRVAQAPVGRSRGLLVLPCCLNRDFKPLVDALHQLVTSLFGLATPLAVHGYGQAFELERGRHRRAISLLRRLEGAAVVSHRDGEPGEGGGGDEANQLVARELGAWPAAGFAFSTHDVNVA